jgi:hypothetical protein
MITVWMPNRWDDAARADVARRWIAGEGQRAIGESLNTTASSICQQVARFCDDWSGTNVRDGYYDADRRKIALVALRNYFFAHGEIPAVPIWQRYDRSNVTDEDYRDARAEHMWLLRAEGLTYRAIGLRLGITGGRVRQVIERFGRRVRRGVKGAWFRWLDTETPRRE